MLPEIYIDADACPVKEDTYRVAERYKLTVHVVSNRPIQVPKATWIVPAVAGMEFDAVDDWIVSHVKPHDVVVTNDLLLAQRCIEAKARVIDPRGKILDEDNIGDALATRELMQELRQMGTLGLGPAKMGKRHRSSFLGSLDELINAAIRAKR